VRAGIPIHVRNTNRPDNPGTRIVPERDFRNGEVVGIASAPGFCTIFVSKYLMNREIGFGRRFLQVFEEEGISFEHMPSGVDNISIILREKDLDATTEKRVVRRIREDLGGNNIYVERDLALIMLVGEGMRYSVGMAARATKALADVNVSIEMINQGSSEISMMFGVKAPDREKAVVSLYRAFFG
jgi:aspartate kinase